MNITAIKDFILRKAELYQSDVLQWLTNIDSYYQCGFVVIVFFLSYCLSQLIRRKFSALQECEHYNSYSPPWLMSRAGRMLYPLLVTLFLAALTLLGIESLENTAIIDAVLRVVNVWILWVVLRAFVLNPLVRVVGLWILVPAALLRLFDVLEPVVEWMKQYGFTLGEVDITLYTIVKGVFLLSIVIWLGRIISQATSSYIMRTTSITRSTKELLIKLFDIILYATLFMISLNLVGIDLTAMAVFSGAFGVGLGFGLQKIASNFISGIILLTEKSININNLIEMDDGVVGHVRKLGARASIVQTFDGKEVMVPNEDFITSRVANLTHSNSKGRVDVSLGVSYGSDLDLVYKLILDAAFEYEPAEKDSEELQPQVYLREFGDSSVNYLLTFWLPDVNTGRWRAKSDVMLSIWRKFKEHGIEIPFPQRDLHIRSATALQCDVTASPSPSKAKSDDSK